MTILRTSTQPGATAGANVPALFLLSLAMIGAVLSVNPLSSLVGVIGLLLIVKFFWTWRQPAILFWALLHQWVQVNAGLIYADLINQDHTVIFRYKPHADEAYLLGMAGLFAFGLGLWLMTSRLYQAPLDSWLNRLDPLKCLKAYLAFIVLFPVIASLPLPGLGQFVIALSFLKWAFFYIFFMSVMHTGRYRNVLLLFMLLELVYSLYSIFAGFKGILIMPLMLLPVFFKGRLRAGHMLAAFLLIAAMINLGIIWSAVKMDYRFFMAGGEKGQVINVSRSEAMQELGRLVSSLDGRKYNDAAIAMIKRLFYLDFLSGVIGNVPARLPHENGAIAIKALTHVVTPRILFPEKEVLHDSVHLNKYVGEQVADYRTTSMGIGYVGDLYIDFGFFAPLAVLGLGMLIGWMYRLLYRQGGGGGWGVFLVMPQFFLIYLFEISLIKQIGLLTTYTLLMLVVSKFMLPRIKRSVEKTGSISAAHHSHVNPRRAVLRSVASRNHTS